MSQHTSAMTVTINGKHFEHEYRTFFAEQLNKYRNMAKTAKGWTNRGKSELKRANRRARIYEFTYDGHLFQHEITLRVVTLRKPQQD